MCCISDQITSHNKLQESFSALVRVNNGIYVQYMHILYHVGKYMYSYASEKHHSSRIPYCLPYFPAAREIGEKKVDEESADEPYNTAKQAIKAFTV